MKERSATVVVFQMTSKESKEKTVSGQSVFFCFFSFFLPVSFLQLNHSV